MNPIVNKMLTKVYGAELSLLKYCNFPVSVTQSTISVEVVAEQAVLSTPKARRKEYSGSLMGLFKVVAKTTWPFLSFKIQTLLIQLFSSRAARLKFLHRNLANYLMP